jgi:hypothetical protein
MEKFKYAEFAEALVLVHGSRARSEAVMQAAICERAGDRKMVESWLRVMTHLQSPQLQETMRAA